MIGLLSGDPTYKSTISFEAKGIYSRVNFLEQHKFVVQGLISCRSVVDGRKGYLNKFTYCPRCGVKIDWKQIIKNIES
jgi:translation initiation factor 2 beta subunit (eIF-2beta)/eIF-5